MFDPEYTPEQRILKAKMELYKDERFKFYGAASFYYPWVADNNQPTAYASVAGKRYGYNEEFIKGLSHDEVKFLVCHEIEHVARKHASRFKFVEDEKQLKANIACDDVINKSLESVGLKMIKEGVKLDNKYNGMSEEKIFNILPDSEVDKYKIDIDICFGDAKGSGDDKEEEKVYRKMIELAKSLKGCSHLPGSIQQELDNEFDGRVRWHELLKLKLQPIFERDISWSSPHRKMLHQGLYIPGPFKEGVGDIAVFIDTSGSVSLQEISQILGEYKGIMEQMQPERLHLVFFHSCVWRYECINMFEELPIISKAERGGTCFRSPVEYLQKEEIEPKVGIFMTDGECWNFPDQPTYEVFWCSSREEKFPYGQYIKLEFE